MGTCLRVLKSVVWLWELAFWQVSQREKKERERWTRTPESRTLWDLRVDLLLFTLTLNSHYYHLFEQRTTLPNSNSISSSNSPGNPLSLPTSRTRMEAAALANLTIQQKYSKDKKVGEGTYAVVYLGKEIKTGRKIAIKKVTSLSLLALTLAKLELIRSSWGITDQSGTVQRWIRYECYQGSEILERVISSECHSSPSLFSLPSSPHITHWSSECPRTSSSMYSQTNQTWTSSSNSSKPTWKPL